MVNELSGSYRLLTMILILQKPCCTRRWSLQLDKCLAFLLEIQVLGLLVMVIVLTPWCLPTYRVSVQPQDKLLNLLFLVSQEQLIRGAYPRTYGCSVF